jgi:hypothetical protein
MGSLCKRVRYALLEYFWGHFSWCDFASRLGGHSGSSLLHRCRLLLCLSFSSTQVTSHSRNVEGKRTPRLGWNSANHTCLFRTTSAIGTIPWALPTSQMGRTMARLSWSLPFRRREAPAPPISLVLAHGTSRMVSFWVSLHPTILAWTSMSRHSLPLPSRGPKREPTPSS